jgi:type VI secretion system lysozyme-like protein
MARDFAREARVLPSVLDRLIDREPKQPSDVSVSRQKGEADLREALQRDLEDLFNSARPRESSADPHDPKKSGSKPWEPFPEVGRSVVAFGLPDFRGEGLTAPVPADDPEAAKPTAAQRRLLSYIETALAIFEPRLVDVVVSLVTPKLQAGARAPASDLTVRVRIEARLQMTQGFQDVECEVVMPLTSYRFQVKVIRR